MCRVEQIVRVKRPTKSGELRFNQGNRNIGSSLKEYAMKWRLIFCKVSPENVHLYHWWYTQCWAGLCEKHLNH